MIMTTIMDTLLVMLMMELDPKVISGGDKHVFVESPESEVEKVTG